MLCRIENLSYILAWCKLSRLKEGGDLCLDKVELPRLNLSFQERVQAGSGTRVLCSMDHANLFLPTFAGGEQVEALLKGIPHSILLTNDNRELHVLLPNICVARPLIGSSPFSSELVLDRSGDAGKKWAEKTQVQYFLYPIHVSQSFMFTPSLSSALYLLMLRFLSRAYDEVVQLTASIATDAALNEDEGQIFTLLRMTCSDHHPDAHAARLGISLATSDSPMVCPWSVTIEAAKLLTKLYHVSARCRLSTAQELQLLELCDVLQHKSKIVKEIVESYSREQLKNWLK